jgi:hypothetical protein
MRVVKEIPNPQCKITVFSWNQKYLIKLEAGPFEQTFKVSELDILEQELEEILSPDFIAAALKRFDDMRISLQKSMP